MLFSIGLEKSNYNNSIGSSTSSTGYPPFTAVAPLAAVFPASLPPLAAAAAAAF
jgi:hypothetical protein